MPATAAIESRPAASRKSSKTATPAPAKAVTALQSPMPHQAARQAAPALPAFARAAMAPAAPSAAAVIAPLRDKPAAIKTRADALKPRAPLAPLALKTATQSLGTPLAPHIQQAIENSLQVNLSPVRLHADAAAQDKARSLSARAFTFGHDIFLGPGEHPSDLGLIAHEAAHVVQQQSGPAVHRWSADRGDRYERDADAASMAVRSGENYAVRERVSEPRVQRFGVSEALDYIAGAANNIPGFRMFTIVLGVNPINMEHVDRSAANVFRAVVEFIPGGALITKALDKYGVFDKVGNWMEQQIETLGMVGGSIKRALMDFLESLGLRDIIHPGSVWDRAKRIFTDPIDRIKNFVGGLLEGIWKFVRDAILKPIAKLAEPTRGWDLLIAVMGKNPITGEAVPQTADTLIGGFMKLIGEEEIWNNLKRANAVARAWAWFKSVMSGLLGFVSQIPSLFIQALKSLDWSDILDLPGGFMKIAGLFGKFLGSFFSWAGGKIWDLLQIIFEVVAPAVMPYLRKLGGAIKDIFRHPIVFVRNLVAAGKLGFEHFVAKIGGYLKAAFIEWLTGSMTGVYLPQSLDLREIVKFVLSVLGISWQNLRQKLVKVVGETAVKAMETGFDIVVTLVKDGPAAAWEKIKEELSSLKDTVLQSIMEFVIESVVKKGVAKLMSLLVPGGAFIQAIISIYDTIMVFVDKLAKIAQVVKTFLDSMMEIVAGAIGGAAAKLESTLAGLITLAISFLGGFLGLGKIGEKVMNIINTKIRAPIDKALDKLVDWIAGAAKKLGKFVAQAGVLQDPNERLRLASDAAIAAAKGLGQGITRPLLQPLFSIIQVRYGLKKIEPFERSGTWWVHAEVNPILERNMGIVAVDAAFGDAPDPSDLEPMPSKSMDFKCDTLKFEFDVFDKQLQGQAAGLNQISIVDWENNRKAYDESGRGSAVPQQDVREVYRKDLREQGKTPGQVEEEMALLAALHEPDLVAGGFNVISKLGSKYINSSIGSQWRTKVEELEEAVNKIAKKDKPKRRINVKLRSVRIP